MGAGGAAGDASDRYAFFDEATAVSPTADGPRDATSLPAEPAPRGPGPPDDDARTGGAAPDERPANARVSTEQPRRRVLHLLRRYALVFAVIAGGIAAGGLATSVGRREWTQPISTLWPLGALLAVSLAVAPWLFLRFVRTRATDPHSEAPVESVPPPWARMVVIFVLAAAWGWCAAAVDAPLGRFALWIGLMNAIPVATLAWAERQAGRVLVRIEDPASQGRSLRRYLMPQRAVDVVTRRRGGPP